MASIGESIRWRDTIDWKFVSNQQYFISTRSVADPSYCSKFEVEKAPPSTSNVSLLLYSKICRRQVRSSTSLCANDVSARPWQRDPLSGGQVCRAKSFDTFCPLGPVLVTPEVIHDPQNLQIETFLNDMCVQNWHEGHDLFCGRTH
ncbi:hypothetical protein AC1031_003029 [Aphanomyces cochlioides]|nr:hypothetical protein AC1031_003029 [Aphanomyces cochlioides]